MQLVVCTAVQYAVSWSLTSLFSTNMAISETRLQYAVLEINDNVNGRGKFCTPPLSNNEYDCQPPQPQPFYRPFSGTTRVSRCQKRASGLNGVRGDQQRQTYSIQTNQCPPPPSPHMTVSQCDLNQLHDLMNHYHVTPC